MYKKQAVEAIRLHMHEPKTFCTYDLGQWPGRIHTEDGLEMGYGSRD